MLIWTFIIFFASNIDAKHRMSSFVRPIILPLLSCTIHWRLLVSVDAPRGKMLVPEETNSIPLTIVACMAVVRRSTPHIARVWADSKVRRFIALPVIGAVPIAERHR